MSAAWAQLLRTALANTRHRLRVLGALLDELGESIGHPLVTDGERRQIIDEARWALRAASDGADRAALLLAQAPRPRIRWRLLDGVVGVCAAVQDLAAGRGVRVAVAGVDVETRADPGAVEGIVAQLVLDALVAAPRGSTVQVEVTAEPATGLRVRGSSRPAARPGGRSGGRRLRRARALAESIGADIVVLPSPAPDAAAGLALRLPEPSLTESGGRRKVPRALPSQGCEDATDAGTATGEWPEEGT